MDINIQRELDNINSILSFSNQEKKDLQSKTNAYINTQINNINSNKEQQLFTRINNILDKICLDIQNEFNIDKSSLDSIVNQHKFTIDTPLENNSTQNTSPQNTSSDDDSSDDEQDTKQLNTKTKKEEITPPKKKEVKKNNGPVPCPAVKGSNGQVCGKDTVSKCNYLYCGYHKKYFTQCQEC